MPKVIVSDSDLWPKVLAALKSKYNTLYGVARMARVEISEDSITLYLKFAFHKKRLAESKNSTIITDILKNLTGNDMSLHCELDTINPATTASSSAPTNENTAISVDGNPIAAISNIFGGAELLES